MFYPNNCFFDNLNILKKNLFPRTIFTNLFFISMTTGYYCPGGADVATYIVCPAGYYCLAGSQDPTECPMGRFSNATGLTSDAQCSECIGGYYCPSAG